MLRRVLLSTAIYALGKRLGIGQAIAEFARQVKREPDESCLPVAHTIHAFRSLADVELWTEAGATMIGQVRSRAFHEARKRLATIEGWVSVDDDIEAPRETCIHLLNAIDDLRPRIVLAPYRQRSIRGVDVLSVNLPIVRSLRYAGPERETRLLELPRGTHGGGFGLVAMNRRAIETIALSHAGNEELRWVDADDEVKLALFHELIDHGMWHGEDTSFFRRVPDEVTVEVLLSGKIAHDGAAIDLDAL
jgi:hypothetical protein